MKIANYPDFFAGLFFLLFGSLTAYLSRGDPKWIMALLQYQSPLVQGYNMGTGARMGPGYFPYWLGVILAVIGGIVLLKSLGKTEGVRAKGLMRPIMIFGAMMLFSLIAGWLGASPNASLAIGTVAGCALAIFVGMPSMGLILFSITVFGLLLKGVGLFVATTALVVIASAASHEFNKKNLGVGLVVGAILGFIALFVVAYIHKEGGMDVAMKGMGQGIVAGTAIGMRLLVLGAVVFLLVKLPALMLDDHTKQFAGVLAFLLCLGPWVFVDGLKLQMPTWPDQEELVRMFKTDAKRR